MFCTKCGNELSDDMAFCPVCGTKISKEKSVKINEINENLSGEYKFPDVIYEEEKQEIVSTNFTDIIKQRFLEIWHKLSLFEKIMAVSGALFSLFFVAAIIFGNVIAAILAAIQVSILIVSYSLEKEIIKTTKTWLKYVLPIVAIIFIFPYFNAYDFGNNGPVFDNNNENIGSVSDYVEKEETKSKIDWMTVTYSELLPEPKSLYGKIINNTEEKVSIQITDFTLSQYHNYVESCKSVGFSLDATENNKNYVAYNAAGYKLELSFSDYNKRMDIHIDSPLEFEEIDWPTTGIATNIPTPFSNTGEIIQNDGNGFIAKISQTPLDVYYEYVNLCKEKGFDKEVIESEYTYSAKNNDGYELVIDYEAYQILNITLFELGFDVTFKIDFVENWFFNKYDVEVFIDDLSYGILKHGEDKTFDCVLTKGTHKIEFVNEEDNSVKGNIQIETQKNETIELSIYCYGSYINVYNDNKSSSTSSNTNELSVTTAETITVSKNEKDFIGKDYKEVEKMLKEMGFTVFEYKVWETDNQDKKDGMVGAVNIKTWEFGKGDFTKGDIFEKDAIVEICYYDVEEVEQIISITIDNNEEFKNLLTCAENYDVYASFASKYSGQVIEFDASFDHVMLHGNYTTRYDILITAGNFNSSDFIGPYFKFEDVNNYDLDLGFDYGDLSKLYGKNVRITAEVDYFDRGAGILFLKPISIIVK